MASTIESGSSVSHYRVISAIGAGGMGEVYKAHDVTLERTVALKILPPELVRNDERVRRFMQEAKSASSLNHPNIITIHEIGEAQVSSADGVDAKESKPIHYIAMELIDGATLKRKIHDGVTDLRTLVDYMAQAADGLAKAHAAGIVHRDLKPENIMITRDGFAKVLDFGLAKLSVKKSASEGNTATDVREGTREGVILGTVGYMSPEQVRGNVVDHRSDIFSFGCILYEAATRRRPFEADSDIDVMHKIMHEKPPAIDEINPAVPAELRRMIRRCLAKDPDKRYQSMKDLAIELGDVVDEFEELSASTASRSSGSMSQPLSAPHGDRKWLALAIVGAVIAASAVAFVLWRGRSVPKQTQQPAVNYAAMKMQQLTSTNDVAQATISPDGKYVAVVRRDEPHARFDLSVLQVATGASVAVTSSATPFAGIAFTPDSNYLMYGGYEQTTGGYASLFQVPSLGGTPQRILFDIDTAVSFSPDRKQLTFGRGHPDTGENWIMIANADGTSERKLFAYRRIISPPAPVWSPDGKTIAFSAMNVVGGVHQELTAVDVASGAKRVVGKSRWSTLEACQWMPDGKAIVLSGVLDGAGQPQLWLQPFPDGEPTRITNDLSRYIGVAVTADGSTITTTRSERESHLMSIATDGSAPTPLDAQAQYAYDTVAVSRSGAIAFSAVHQKGLDVGMVDKPGSAPRLLTHDGVSSAVGISDDGRKIVFDSLRAGHVPHVFIMDSDGEDLRQLSSGEGEGAAAISPDGTFVTYNSLDGRAWRVAATGGQPQLLEAARSSFRYRAAPISPDGKYFITTGWLKENGRTSQRLIVRDFATLQKVKEVPWPIGGSVRWTHKGDIAFLSRGGGVSNVMLYPLDGPPKALTHFNDGQIWDFDDAPDGKLILARGEVKNDVVLISNFR